MITEFDDLKQLDEVVRDAINAVMELYEDTGKEFPPSLIEQRRDRLVDSIKEAREEYARGEMKKGTVDDLMKALLE